jgi:hypothetical protein
MLIDYINSSLYNQMYYKLHLCTNKKTPYKVHAAILNFHILILILRFLTPIANNKRTTIELFQ